MRGKGSTPEAERAFGVLAGRGLGPRVGGVPSPRMVHDHPSGGAEEPD